MDDKTEQCSPAFVDENLRPYLEMTADWAFALNDDLVITNCFRNTEINYGYTPNEMVGKSFVHLVPEEYRDKLKGLFANSRLQEKGKFLVTYINEEGHSIDVSAICHWEQGVFRQYKVLIRNRTHRINRGWIRANFSDELFVRNTAERADSGYWETQALQYELLAAVSLAFAGSGQFDEMMEKALKIIGTYQKADRCVITHIDRERRQQGCLYEWHSEHTHSAKLNKQNDHFDESNAFYRMLMSSPYVGIPNTAQMHDDLRGQFVIENEKAFIHFPIFVDDILFGSFGIDYCREPHDWSESEITMFQTIVNCMASAIKRNRAEVELRKNNALLEKILRNYPGVIWYCDAERKCTMMDGGETGMLGFRPEDFLNRDMLAAARENDVPALAAAVADTASLQSSRRVNFERNKRHFSLTTTPLHDARGAVTGQVGVCLDITDLTRVQQQLRDAIVEAQDASKAKSEFLSRMSHEIRTPMNAIIGMTTIARKSQDPAKTNYCLDKIEKASNQLLNIINDVLDIAKIEANKLELSEAEFDFEKMLQNVCNVIDVQVSRKRQNFIIDFSEIFHRYVVADELRLSQVMINLLSNAVKFTPEGGSVILRIRHSMRDQNNGVFHIEVADNGIGISEEQQARLFSSFEQADSSITRKYGGTGLGLVICKSIVTLMGGKISLESEPGQGARFSFSVNVRWGNTRATHIALSDPDLRDVRILVIDDSRDVLEYFENILQTYSLGCDTAHNGAIGIDKVKKAIQAAKPYDLIFVDWMMPGMDGMETAKAIKELTGPETVVIMISVADWSDITRGADSIGVDRFLSKPVLPSTLFNSILEWTSRPISPGTEARVNLPTMDWSGKTMLLVDDIEINREIIADMLADTRLKIEFAADGKQGVEAFSRAPDRYSLVLMDVQMPEMDGFEATRRIRQCGRAGAGVPILAMTANAFREDVEKCLSAGMNDHIPKPVDVDDLMHKVTTWIAGSRQN